MVLSRGSTSQRPALANKPGLICKEYVSLLKRCQVIRDPSGFLLFQGSFPLCRVTQGSQASLEGFLWNLQGSSKIFRAPQKPLTLIRPWCFVCLKAVVWSIGQNQDIWALFLGISITKYVLTKSLYNIILEVIAHLPRHLQVIQVQPVGFGRCPILGHF